MLPALWISKWQWNIKTPWEKIFPRGFLFFITKEKEKENSMQHSNHQQEPKKTTIWCQWNDKTPWGKNSPKGFFKTKEKRNFNALLPVDKNPWGKNSPKGFLFYFPFLSKSYYSSVGFPRLSRVFARFARSDERQATPAALDSLRPPRLLNN